jgi:endonuclease/exonuclease/phosphatase family metal-dependent hydrolase
MVRRKPAQYDWDALKFDETILKKHFTAPRRSKIKFVVVHHMTIIGTGDGDALDGCWNTWQNRQASAHYGVDGDLVRQFVWDGNAGWATADPTGNHAGISIEHANSTYGPGWHVSEKTWKNGARLAAHLHVAYKLGRPVRGKTLRQHDEFFATACPGPFLGGSIWPKYVAEAQRVYDQITKPPTKPAVKPPTKRVVRWHSTAFLNTHGDDGADGGRTFKARTPQMVEDVTEGRPEVVGFCEVTKAQQPDLTDAMEAEGYKLAGYFRRLALYVLPDVEVRKVDFSQYSKQNAGAIEGILRARLKVNGSWVHYGLTHLDYRDGFDAGRVTQMNQGKAAMQRFAARWLLPDWKNRTVIMGDFNSETWVLDKSLKPAGFKDAGAGARIDFVVVGAKRPVLDADNDDTESDHPVTKVTVGKFV